MNKYQKLDYLANYSHELEPPDIWAIVNSFSPEQVREVMPLIFACDLGSSFEQAAGIADWTRTTGHITDSQCRWIILTIASRWHTLEPARRFAIQPSL